MFFLGFRPKMSVTTTNKFMEIEVAHKTGAEKGIHAETRTGDNKLERKHQIKLTPGLD